MSEKIQFVSIDPIMEDYEKQIQHFNNELNKGKHTFLFLYMDGCGPCNSTKPNWDEIGKYLKEEHLKNDKIIVAKINQKLLKNDT